MSNKIKLNSVVTFLKSTKLYKNKLTLALFSSSHFGLKKYLIPLSAPSRLNDRIKNTTMSKNGKVAVKYRTFAEDFILFQSAK